MSIQKKKIAFLGPEASFSHIATEGLFYNQELLPCTTIPECIEKVGNGEVEFAVVPLENALEGTVPLTIDYLFHDANLYIVGEILLKIQQHLMVNKAQVKNWHHIEGIYSHPHAIAQCHKYLFYRFSKVPLNHMSSTSAAARFVSEHPEKCIASIGNSYSAEKYNLAIVEQNIHDFHFNHTRFVVLAKDNIRLEMPGTERKPKTTFMITLPSDVSGALHQALSVFAWRKLNLSKIESRPLKTGLGQYFFIFDVLADEKEPMMKWAVEELQALGCTVKTLGTYYTYICPE